jgi:regulator of ribonuclease activity A
MSAVLERFAGGAVSTSDLVDELVAADEEVRSCDVPLRSYGGRARFAGPLRTVRCHDDNVQLRDLLSAPGDGAVLVIDGGGSLHTALLGDVIAGMAVENGWAGLVIHGCVRDVVALAELPIGIRALASNPRKSGKSGAGDTNVPVSFGGVTFTPGDLVLADEDGILAMPGARQTAGPAQVP